MSIFTDDEWAEIVLRAKAEGAAEERGAMLAFIFELRNGPVMHVFRYAKSAMKVLDMLERSVRTRGSTPAPDEAREKALEALRAVVFADNWGSAAAHAESRTKVHEALALLEPKP